MKTFLPILLFIFVLLPLHAEKAEEITPAPKGPLSEVEKKLVGKWKGTRLAYRWEIHRKDDRTFEIACSEPNPDNFAIRFSNYAVGVWWVEGEEYKFAWNEWWGEDGDLGGILVEKIKSVEADKVVTITEDDEQDPDNVEVRVEEFVSKDWKLKPEAVKGAE
jgi:hypothetical protein